MELKRERLTCPICHIHLYFEQIQGMRVIKDGKLNARCPKCKKYYSMPKKVNN